MKIAPKKSKTALARQSSSAVPKRTCTTGKPEDSGKSNQQSAPVKANPDARHATVERIAPGSLRVTIAKNLDDTIWDICAPTGMQYEEVAIRILDQIAASLVPRPKDQDLSLMQAIGAIAGLAPQNATEGYLATQMIATHEAAVRFMALATQEDQTFQGRDANVLRATRLMRLHLDQIEAMSKLKGAAQQKVVVEHVHVHAGGQAIVGSVESGGSKPGAGVGA